MNHCISSSGVHCEFLNYFGTKIVNSWNLSSLANKKYCNQIEYANIGVLSNYPNDLGWGRYRDILDQCINLKEIALSCRRRNFMADFIVDILPSLPNAMKKIWEERISYFDARNIRVVNRDAILDNKDFHTQLAKDARIRWRFHLHFSMFP
jgi:hypothetical protein